MDQAAGKFGCAQKQLKNTQLLAHVLTAIKPAQGRTAFFNALMYRKVDALNNLLFSLTGIATPALQFHLPPVFRSRPRGPT